MLAMDFLILATETVSLESVGEFGVFRIDRTILRSLGCKNVKHSYLINKENTAAERSSRTDDLQSFDGAHSSS
uniref:Uncharacterized protein n=1 Tax=Romanomermis culicivorax TaxID=13658 RepID=A0A915IC15_ROMCU